MGDFVVVVAFERPDRQRFVVVRHVRRGWELPGGRLLADEKPEEAARREFAEETGRELLDVVRFHERRKGGRTGWTVAGLLGPSAVAAAPESEPTVEWRLVERLGDVGPLAFPDDPYDAIGRALQRPLL